MRFLLIINNSIFIITDKFKVNFFILPIDNYIARRYNITTLNDISLKVVRGGIKMSDKNEYGALTEPVYYILLSLYTPLHGYGIMQNVKELSGDRVTLGAGTLYGAINTLLEKAWIKPFNENRDSRKKEYVITDIGKNVVKNEIIRLEELIRNGKAVTES